MKIVHIVTNADLSGAPIYVRELAVYQKSIGYDVSVIFGEEGAVKDSLALAGVNVLTVNTLRSRINLRLDLASFHSLKVVLSACRPDIVHCHSSKAGMLGRIVCAYLRIPVVYTVHGWGFGPRRNIQVSVLVFIVEALLKKITSRFIAVSDFDRKIGIRWLRIPDVKIVTVHNGVQASNDCPVEQFSHSRLIMVARNDPQKDYATLFRALNGSKFDEIYVVGRGTEDSKFVELAKVHSGNSFSKIKFLGVRTDIPSLLDQCSIFLLISNYEGLPISIIEAMSKGLPVIASDVGGVSELVDDGCTGYLVSPANIGQLRDQISQLSQDIELRRLMGRNGYIKFTSRFTANLMNKAILAVYEDLIML